MGIESMSWNVPFFQYYDCMMRLLPCGPAATLLRLASVFFLFAVST